jgi:SNF2 family DNA or RNA helicase
MLHYNPTLKFIFEQTSSESKVVTRSCKIHPSYANFSIQFFKTDDEPNYIQIAIFVKGASGEYLVDKSNFYNQVVEINQNFQFVEVEDALIINWLLQENLKEYKNKDSELYTNVVKKIPSRFEVRGLEVFELNAIISEPIPRVLISELSNTYLMLTPQFNYDGFIIDGPFNTIAEKINEADNKTYVINRNEIAEQEFTESLKQLHANFIKQRNGYFYLSFADAKKKHWFLNTYHSLLENNVELVGMDMLSHFRYSPHKAATTFAIQPSNSHLVESTMEVHFGKEKIKLSELQKVILAEQKTILLKDDSIAVLDDEWLNSYGILLRNAKVKGGQLSFAKWLLLSIENNTTITQAAFDKESIKEWMLSYKNWQVNENDTLINLPQSIQATLRPYQQKGYEWLCLLSQINAGACLADDMGLGKTLQTLSYLCKIKEQDNKAIFLVACPTSLLYNWLNEVSKFAPSLKAVVLNEALKKEEWPLGFDLYIVSYGMLRNKIEYIQEPFWDTVIIDESHNIKNIYAQTTQALKYLKSRFRIAISGTPIMNNTFDLYSQLNFLLPDFLGGVEHFKKHYANAIDRDKNDDKAKELRMITQPFLLRRTKEKIAQDLPEKTVETIWCDMEDGQRSFYENLKKDIYGNLKNEINKVGAKKAALSVLAGITKLRQACCAPAVVKNYNGAGVDSIKIKTLVEYIKDKMQNHKALVFSQYVEVMDIIATAFNNEGISYYRFDGRTESAERKELIDAFQQQQDNTNVFLISLKSGNAGITLTAADYVFLVDPWWNTAIENQAIDRTHRIGQTKNVFAYKMICRDSIEEKILSMQLEKQKVSDDLISTEGTAMPSLDEDQIKILFE